MIDYPGLNLPDYFIYLLRINILSTAESFRNISTYVEKHKNFHTLVKQSFYDIEGDLDVYSILKSVGWKTFRNRIAGLYLYYFTNGEFPSQLKNDVTSELVYLEESLEPYTIDNFSRSFLLAFYLKLARFDLTDRGMDDHLTDLVIDDDVIDILKDSKAKTIKIDWLLLTILHFKKFFGKENLIRSIVEGRTYEELFKNLNQDNKDKMMGNLLSYGYSINDHEIFTEMIV